MPDPRFPRPFPTREAFDAAVARAGAPRPEFTERVITMLALAPGAIIDLLWLYQNELVEQKARNVELEATVTLLGLTDAAERSEG